MLRLRAALAQAGSAGGAGSTGTSAKGGATGSGGVGGASLGDAGATNGTGGATAGTDGAVETGTLQRWGVFEVTLTGPASGNPYVDVTFSATFTQGDKVITMPGFWDTGATYKIRFSPPTAGEWTYQTVSASAELNGKSGSFKAAEASGSNHGPVVITDKFYLQYADGSRYHMFGTTSYQWTSMPEELQQTTLKTLATTSFTKYRYAIFPKWYAYNKVEPDRAAFLKGADGKYDFKKPDPAFWARFEQRILDLQKMGIEAELILWHPYDNWGFKSMGCGRGRSLPPLLHRQIVSLPERLVVVGQRMGLHGQARDRLRPSWLHSSEGRSAPTPAQHSQRRQIFDQSKPWITHVSLQKYDTNNGLSYRTQYNKPIVFDEFGYEGDIPEGYGRNPPLLIAERFYWATFTGIYGTHGECFKDPADVLWWGKGGVLKGESWKRVKFLKDMLDAAPPFNELKPSSGMVLAKEGQYYLMFCQSGGNKTIQLGGTGPYKVDRLDMYEMTTTPVGTAPAAPTPSQPPRGRGLSLRPLTGGF